jgi:hypothetical protein
MSCSVRLLRDCLEQGLDVIEQYVVQDLLNGIPSTVGRRSLRHTARHRPLRPTGSVTCDRPTDNRGNPQRCPTVESVDHTTHT